MKVFEIPESLLTYLALAHDGISINENDSFLNYQENISIPIEPKLKVHSNEGNLIKCVTCQVEAEDKIHFKSDFHRYNLKRRVNDEPPISEDAFETLEEISSIDASSDDESEANYKMIKSKRGSPFIHFLIKSSPDPEEEILVYKQVLASKPKDDVNYMSLLHDIQLKAQGESWTLIMMASGHFSAAVIDLISSKPLMHKTFHRYTTRRKQGGAQSSNDKSKGKANSAGAGIRRYNEQALDEEIQELLKDWKSFILNSSRVFIRAPVNSKAKLFADLIPDENRIRSFPFITKRPTFKELMRCFEELTTVKQQRIVKSEPFSVIKSKTDKPSLSEHEKKMIEAVKKGNVDDADLILKAGLVDLNLQLPDSDGISFLHIAAQHSQSKIITLLLENGADPTVRGKQIPSKPYDLVDSKESRDSFRRFMGKYPSRWNYDLSNIPSPLTSEMESIAAEKAKEKRKKDKERKRAQKKESAPVLNPEEDISLPSVKSISISKSMKESFGMSADQRMRLDREKRAVAAEARMRTSKNQCGYCQKSLSGSSTFEKDEFKYCSLACIKEHSILFSSVH